MSLIEVPQKNLTLINFNIHLECISKLINIDLRKYNLIDEKITNKDVKRIIYHHVTYNVIQLVLKQYNNQPVIVFNLNDTNEYTSIVIKLLAKLIIMLPVNIYIVDHNIFETARKITKLTTELEDMTNTIAQQRKNIQRKEFTLQKIKNFAVRHDLTFLSNDYLNRLKTKHIMF